MKRILLAATALSAFAATAAYAADLPPAFQPEQVVSAQSAYDWSGFYAGVNAGYGWGQVEIPAAGVTNDLNGALGGAQVGYNQDFGGFVLGLEGDVQLSGLSFDDAVLGGTESLQYFGTVRARAGVAVDRFMPYVTGGLAFGRGKIEAPVGSDTQDHFGWTVGAGVEYAITDSISVKGEYLYTDLGTQTYAPGGFPADAALRFSTARVGVNFQF